MVIVDLKLGSLTHADVGQTRMYCNYAGSIGPIRMRAREWG